MCFYYIVLINYLSVYFRYHLKDVIVGKIYFLLVRIKIKHMEIAIIKRETTGSGKIVLFIIKYSKFIMLYYKFIVLVLVNKNIL